MKHRLRKDISRILAVMLAVSLLFAALPTLASAAEETDGVTVTATSNFFPAQVMHFSEQELAAKDYKLTVTYTIQSDKPMLNNQWKLTYSGDVLDVLEADNTDGTASTIMPNSTDGSVFNIKPHGESRIAGSCSNIHGYPLHDENGGAIAFVSVTFRAIDAGEATVNLDLQDFTVIDGQKDSTIVNNSRVKDSNWNGMQSTAVRIGGYADAGEPVKPTLSLRSTEKLAAAQTVTLSMSSPNGITGYYWGRSSQYSQNSYFDSGNTAEITVNSPGTYYATAADKHGNLSETLSITFYKITFDANGGVISPDTALAEADKPFTPPVPQRTGYAFRGWSKYANAVSGSQTVRPKTNRTYYAVWQSGDIQKPTVTLKPTNYLANAQDINVTLDDDVMVEGYYWGTDTDYTKNRYIAIRDDHALDNADATEPGTYYATAVDTSGNLSETASVTFFRTTLNATGGAVSPDAILTAEGNSFTFPTPTRSGFTYRGWARFPGAPGGVKVLAPNSNRTYYVVWTNDDTEKPTVSLSATNNLAGEQTVTLQMDDNTGIAGYYWGTSSDHRYNSFSASGKEVSLRISTAGTYYATAIDTSGNLSDTQAVTFYKTMLNANGGSVSMKAVLTQAGKSFDFPKPTRSGYKYLGWASSPMDDEGYLLLQPIRSTTYYAVWQLESNGKPTVKLTSTNDVAARQTVILTMKDSDGIRGYYWGTNPDCTKNKFIFCAYNSAGENVTASGTYYAVVMDKNGNLSDRASVTFYATLLHSNGGSVRVSKVLTQAGKSFALPAPVRENYFYLGWAAKPDATEGVKTLTPTANATYYALWKNAEGFVWGRDNWNFNNSKKPHGFFPATTFRNQISSEYLKILGKNLTNSAYAKVFTGSLGNKAWLDREWDGSCYGMSALALLSKNGYLPFQDYKSSANCLHDLNLTDKNRSSDVCSLVNYYQMLQANDIINQQYYVVSNSSNKQNIEKIIDLLNKNEAVLICYKKSGWGSHAVLAYDYEIANYDKWTKNGISYQGCIKVCDPNTSLSNNTERYIYFNTKTYDWAIPDYSYGNVKSSKGAVFTLICADANIINDRGYLTGVSANSTDNYVARIDALAISDNHTVKKVAEKDGSYIGIISAPGDIVEDYYYDMNGESEGIMGYNLYDSDEAYFISQDLNLMNLTIRYKNCYMTGYTQAGYSMLFDPSGYVELTGEPADYEITMTFDDSYPTDWFTMLVSGQAATASLRMVKDGYILTADNLKNVRLRANNTDVTASLIFSTDAKSVLIYEIDETTIGLKTDSDGDGTYETNLTQNVRKLGDVNGDGKVNVRDLTALQRCLAEQGMFSEDDRAAADINNDGKVDVLDATGLQRYLAEYVSYPSAA